MAAHTLQTTPVTLRREHIARIEQSEIRDGAIPHCAALHAGYRPFRVMGRVQRAP
jgi:hypothetical protein